jgi:hypothetical protein
LAAGEAEAAAGAANTSKEEATWDRCYNFLNILAKKFGEKIGACDSRQS